MVRFKTRYVVEHKHTMFYRTLGALLPFVHAGASTQQFFSTTPQLVTNVLFAKSYLKLLSPLLGGTQYNRDVMAVIHLAAVAETASDLYISIYLIDNQKHN